MSSDSWKVFKDKNILSECLAADIIYVANESIKKSGQFNIILAGGKSFIDTYKILRDAKSNWIKWHIYICDERCLPINDRDRNDRIINEVWLNNVKIPRKNINFICAELGIEEAVKHYESVLKNNDIFDLVLLGMGEDGHTASLFPNHTYNQNNNVVVEYNSPKFPKKRMSLSYVRLNKSKYVYKLISGPSKSQALRLWMNGEKLPINQIFGKKEKVYILNDALLGII
jgi:6-phosphogluconolactonase